MSGRLRKMWLLIFNCFCALFFFPPGIFCEHDHGFDWGETALTMRDFSNNQTKFMCVWRPPNSGRQCPDSINFYFYSGPRSARKEKINLLTKNSLSETRWDPQKENIIYIHGYGGGDGTFPNYILRDAYIRNGSYNVFVVDWGPLAALPCYPAAVYNLNAVARCTANLYRNLRSQGISSNKITCVGHSLGAHGCGLVSNHIDFRMHRIIGLDPAGVMIPRSTRLRPGMADSVQVMHTNAGMFGDSTSGGRVNFCMNGGRMQPICEGTSFASDLCSHVVVVCYMAESIDGSTARKAQPCSRQCPYGPRRSLKTVHSVLVGQHTPNKASGSYCIHTHEPPYCPSTNNPRGDPWCCLRRRATKKIKEQAKVWNKHKPE